jgi:hypothetical protein
MAQMPDTAKSLEAIKLVSDWAKWLVTIETAIITVIGAFFATDQLVQIAAKVLGTLAIGSFTASIIAAAILLMTLPEIAQNLRADQNIWLTQDSVAGPLLRLNTQRIALIESVFFGLGIILVVVMIVITIWS